MIILSNGYKLTKEEWKFYHKLKPSKLQRFINLFFPLKNFWKIKIYKKIKSERDF